MIISSVKIPAVKASRPRSFLVMSSPDKISIALCTYNGEQFLSRQLKSIFSSKPGRRI